MNEQLIKELTDFLKKEFDIKVRYFRIKKRIERKKDIRQIKFANNRTRK